MDRGRRISALRTTAAIVAAVALVAIALFTYQVAQPDREVACWTEAYARNDWSVPADAARIDRC